MDVAHQVQAFVRESAGWIAIVDANQQFDGSSFFVEERLRFIAVKSVPQQERLLKESYGIRQDVGENVAGIQPDDPISIL